MASGKAKRQRRAERGGLSRRAYARMLSAETTASKYRRAGRIGIRVVFALFLVFSLALLIG